MPEIEAKIMMANPVPEWANESGYEWFGEAYAYASNQTRAIPACSKCTPNELFYFLVAALRELDLLAPNPNADFRFGMPISRVPQVLAAREPTATEQITATDRKRPRIDADAVAEVK